jgi:hypothetical protein
MDCMRQIGDEIRHGHITFPPGKNVRVVIVENKYTDAIDDFMGAQGAIII